MKKDISSTRDIQLLINTFYEKVKMDEVISHFFSDVVPVDWDNHLPIMCRFWESILLDNPVYQDNAMARHFHIHRKSPMETKHFDRWLQLFHGTVDDLFSGEIAEKAKSRSNSIARLMEHQMKAH